MLFSDSTTQDLGSFSPPNPVPAIKRRFRQFLNTKFRTFCQISNNITILPGKGYLFFFRQYRGSLFSPPSLIFEGLPKKNLIKYLTDISKLSIQLTTSFGGANILYFVIFRLSNLLIDWKSLSPWIRPMGTGFWGEALIPIFLGSSIKPLMALNVSAANSSPFFDII